ncbi:MAG: hypothetical protein P8Z36_04785 [Gemmatimonadota bacterium]|jgi:hypothetical protein
MNDKWTGPTADREQLLYARILAVGMYTGLLLLLLTFAVYVSGIVQPAVPIDRLPEYWGMNVEEYLQTINANHLHRPYHLAGWWWLTALDRSDYLNFLGIALLSAVTILCFAGIAPTFLKKRDFAYGIMAIAEIVILVLAASGILRVGH